MEKLNQNYFKRLSKMSPQNFNEGQFLCEFTNFSLISEICVIEICDILKLA